MYLCIDMSHIEDRQVKTWGSYGKDGDEPLTFRLIKDLSDSHLENIIIFIERYHTMYSPYRLRLMKREVEFRQLNGISVPDYPNSTLLKSFKFLR